MDIDKLIKNLSVEEKCSLLVGKNSWETKDIERLGIPAIFMADGPHGLRKVIDNENLVETAVKAVCFPSLVTIASSFDPEVSYRMGEAIAEEFRANGVSLILGPGINIKRHPYCGRNFEYFSEDPLVTSKLASGYIKGAKSQDIGVCLKHYALNSQESYRMVSNSIVDERAKYEIYYRSFQRLMALKPEMVMCSYNRVDDNYASENINLLNDVLRKEFGFEGVIVSDWTAVNDRTQALVASLDLEMPGYIYGVNKLIQDYHAGLIDLSVLDESVKRIIQLVERFQNQKTIESKLEEHHQLAAELAASSMVLLKNENNILPLKHKEKILLIGEMAENIRYQGGGSSNINSYKVDNITDIMLKNPNVDYLQGYHLNESLDQQELSKLVLSKAKEYDKIVFVGGLPKEYESEGFDRLHLSIPQNQIDLIEAITDINSQLVLILSIGSPIAMPFKDRCRAILNCYLAGEALGIALERVLYGTVNPSGRLAESFPISVTDVPSNDSYAKGNHNVFYKESIYVGYRYYQSIAKAVTFPFGHGLSYSNFVYDNLRISETEIKSQNDVLTLSVEVNNQGPFDGQEVVLLFFEAKDPLTPRPRRELLDFQKILIKNGETLEVNFQISSEQLAYYNIELKQFVCDDGLYHLQIAKNAEEIILETAISVNSGIVYPETLWQKLPSYDIKQSLNFDKADFEQLIQRDYSDETVKFKRPFTINNNIEDIQSTILGKLFKKIILRIIDKTMKDADEHFLLMIKDSILEQPLRSLVPFSGGMIKMNQMIAIVELINFRLLKVIKHLFRKD